MEISSNDLNDWLSDSPLSDLTEYVVLGEYGTKKGAISELYIERCLFFVPEDRANHILSIDGQFWLDNFRANEYVSCPIDDPINYVKDDEGGKYEKLVYSWGSSAGSQDTKSIWPSMRLAQWFCLIPRIIKDLENDKIVWDDLSKPIYDVLICNPISKYISCFNIESACVTIRKEYLMKFAREIKCDILELFFVETRYDDSDGKYSWDTKNELGLSYKVVCDGKGFKTEQIYGVRPVVSSSRDIEIIEEKEVDDYDWPKGSSNTRIFVKDIFLRHFESMDDVVVFPYRTSVEFRNQWGFDGFRNSRNAIAFNTFDLNVPEYVLDILYRNCMSEKEFFQDRKVYGGRSIADRAQDLCDSFCDLMSVISVLLEIPIKKLFPIEKENGDMIWWCKSDLKVLGYCAPLDMSKGELATRCRNIIKYLIESMNERIMRTHMVHFGVPRDELKAQGSIKLIGYLLQIINVIIEKGYNKESDVELILSDWDKDKKLPFWSTVFFVNQIRSYESHKSSSDQELNILINKLGIDSNLLRSQGGLILDKIYEKLTESFRTGACLINKVLVNC